MYKSFYIGQPLYIWHLNHTDKETYIHNVLNRPLRKSQADIQFQTCHLTQGYSTPKDYFDAWYQKYIIDNKWHDYINYLSNNPVAYLYPTKTLRRGQLWSRTQDNKCYICNKQCALNGQVEHYVPRAWFRRAMRLDIYDKDSLLPKHTIDYMHSATNLLLACEPCNRQKHCEFSPFLISYDSVLRVVEWQLSMAREIGYN